MLLFFSTGHVTWDEYRVKFLASKGFTEQEVAEKIKNNEDLKLDEESKCRTIRHSQSSRIRKNILCIISFFSSSMQLRRFWKV